MFNSDAINSYNATYTPDNPLTPAVEVNNWMNPMGLIAPQLRAFVRPVDLLSHRDRQFHSRARMSARVPTVELR